MLPLISPTEPPSIRSLGKTSSLPEKHGVDILWAVSPTVIAGIQRKEIADLVASLNDGRLAMELGQINCSTLLTDTFILLEGQPSWTNEGQLILNRQPSGYSFTRHTSLLLSLSHQGITPVHSPNLSMTSLLIPAIGTYLSKTTHRTLSRPNPKGRWGTPTSRDWSVWLLQSFPGIGPDRAEAIVDAFGEPPLAWTVSEDELAAVEGLGPVSVKRLMEALPSIQVPRKENEHNDNPTDA